MLAALYTVTDCSSSQPIQQFITPKRSDSHTLYLTFDPAPYFAHLSDFNWNTFVAPDTDNFDVVGKTDLMLIEYGSARP